MISQVFNLMNHKNPWHVKFLGLYIYKEFFYIVTVPN